MLADYAFGTVHFMLVKNVSVDLSEGVRFTLASQPTDLWSALSVCVFPFVLLDLIKAAAASVTGVYVKEGLKRARLL